MKWRETVTMHRSMTTVLAKLAPSHSEPDEIQDSADHIGQHGAGHAEMHDVYKAWHPPDNPKTSCCNNADCRPTRAYVDENGTWRAWNGLLWLVVPPDRVLPTDLAGDGRSHLCENAGYIYCFTPAPPRS
jgi:hypothetical protein